MTRIGASVVTLLLVVLAFGVGRAAPLPRSAELKFWNATDREVVVRCIGRDHAEHKVRIPPGGISSDNAFAPGNRVAAVWFADGSQADAYVFQATAGRTQTLIICVKDGRLNITTESV
jgi:hypothetical protein